MTKRNLAIVLMLVWTAQAQAGHGLMNSFGDVKALPDAGRMPDQMTYKLDRISETMRLALADNSVQRLVLLLEFAREKLAEITAMVAQSKPAAAQIAIDQYSHYIVKASAEIAQIPMPEAAQLIADYANALLEHQYIMSVDYLDLPRSSRTVIAGVIAIAANHYAALEAAMSPAFKASQFFKEEEVRWTWSMALAADEQGL